MRAYDKLYIKFYTPFLVFFLLQHRTLATIKLKIYCYETVFVGRDITIYREYSFHFSHVG